MLASCLQCCVFSVRDIEPSSGKTLGNCLSLLQFPELALHSFHNEDNSRPQSRSHSPHVTVAHQALILLLEKRELRNFGASKHPVVQYLQMQLLDQVPEYIKEAVDGH